MCARSVKRWESDKDLGLGVPASDVFEVPGHIYPEEKRLIVAVLELGRYPRDLSAQKRQDATRERLEESNLSRNLRSNIKSVSAKAFLQKLKKKGGPWAMARSGALEPASESSARGDRVSDSGRGQPVSDVMRFHEVPRNVFAKDAAPLEEVVNLGHYPRDPNAEHL